MNWIKVSSRDDMPKDRPFLAIWKGHACIARFHSDENSFYICFDPSQYDNHALDLIAESKFSYWAELPQQPWENNEQRNKIRPI